MRIAICEDNDAHLAELVNMLAEISPNNSSYSVRTFRTGDLFWFHYQEALDAPGNEMPYDLIIMDIEMPGEHNGLDVAKKIRMHEDRVTISLLTSFTKYLIDGYDARPYSYMQKPVQKDKLLEVIKHVERHMQTPWNGCFNIATAGGFLHIPYSEIFHLESRGHNVFVHTKDDVYKLYCKLSDVLPLCDERFIQTHKSYVINVDKMRHAGDQFKKLFLVNGKEIPISEKMKPTFVKLLLEHDRLHKTVKC